MQNAHQLLYNEEDDMLEIIKNTSNQSVDFIEGKYGIQFHRDISDNIVRISIPEATILFGISASDIISFVTYSSSS